MIIHELELECFVPVVIIADLMADGDQEACTDFIKATIPVTWGQAMEVPDSTLKFIFAVAGDQAARIFSPGARTSGYKFIKYVRHGAVTTDYLFQGEKLTKTTEEEGNSAYSIGQNKRAAH